MDDQQFVLADTENFMIWYTIEEGENIYHVELGSLTLHLSSDEWDEFVILVKTADDN